MQETGISSRRSPAAPTETQPESPPKDRISASTRVTKQASRIGVLGQCLILSLILFFVFFFIHSPRYICSGVGLDLFSRKHLISVDGLDSEFGSLGVPWCRSKLGDNVEWTKKDLLKGLEEFVPIYETRPIKNNMYGMGFDHSFGLWFITRWLKPDLMIESGAFKGHSTWVLRQAMPDKPIVSLSPRHPEKYLAKMPAYVDANCTYYAGKKFVDFGSMDWDNVMKNHGISDLGRVPVFFDDHQNELKRLKQALKAGFKHLYLKIITTLGLGTIFRLGKCATSFIFEVVDTVALKIATEARMRKERKGFWDRTMDVDELCGPGEKWWGVRGEMRDNFNHSNQVISLAEHFENSRYVESLLDVYWELPPVAGPSLTHQTRYDPARTVDPIVEDGRFGLFQRLGLGRLDVSVFNGYTQMVYLRISSPSS